MPQHGPDLFSSDIGSIMRDEYKNFLAFNYEPKDVLVIFKKYFLHDSSSKRDKDLFWLIMARMQVNYGCLLDEVRDKALMVIESGDDIKQWEEYVFIEKHISSYQVITNELIQKNLLKDVDNIQERAQTFLEEFHKLQDEKLTEYLQDDHLPEEVLRYFNEKGFSKIEIFGNDGKKYLKKRIEVIETLEKDIANFEPSKKKFSKPYSFDPEWKIGDVYAYKLVEEEDQYGWIKDVNFYDKYILFEVVGIDRKAISRILPSLAVRTEVCVKSYIFIDDTLPNISELDNLEYLSMRRIRYKDNIEKLGKFIKDKEAIFFVIFYGETKKIKKMQL
ncbi:MAG: hypothetical protein WC874_02595, partial [Candidatus Izemoplasmatales bacterium]